jgi:hypothetical protein
MKYLNDQNRLTEMMDIELYAYDFLCLSVFQKAESFEWLYRKVKKFSELRGIFCVCIVGSPEFSGQIVNFVAVMTILCSYRCFQKVYLSV